MSSNTEWCILIMHGKSFSCASTAVNKVPCAFQRQEVQEQEISIGWSHDQLLIVQKSFFDTNELRFFFIKRFLLFTAGVDGVVIVWSVCTLDELSHYCCFMSFCQPWKMLHILWHFVATMNEPRYLWSIVKYIAMSYYTV